MYGMLAKPEKPLWKKVLQAIQSEKRVVGRHDLTKAVWPSGQWSLEDVRRLNTAVDYLITSGQVNEEKKQIEGTGHQGPPCYEYVYTLKGTKS